jgi:copper chaperone CopZ
MSAAGMTPDIDLKVLLPEDGTIRVESARLFGEPDGALCRHFVQRAFLALEIERVVVAPGPAPAIELQFDATQRGQRQVLEHIAELLAARDWSGEAAAARGGALEVPPAATARDQHGVVRYHRYARRVTGWRVTCERVGMIKLENPVLYRKAALCEAIERELMGVLGVDRYETSPRNCRAKIEYDPRQLGPAQIIEILDSALANAEHPDGLDKPSWNWRSAPFRSRSPQSPNLQCLRCFRSLPRCSLTRRSRVSGAPMKC